MPVFKKIFISFNISRRFDDSSFKSSITRFNSSFFRELEKNIKNSINLIRFFFLTNTNSPSFILNNYFIINIFSLHIYKKILGTFFSSSVFFFVIVNLLMKFKLIRTKIFVNYYAFSFFFFNYCLKSYFTIYLFKIMNIEKFFHIIISLMCITKYETIFLYRVLIDNYPEEFFSQLPF